MIQVDSVIVMGVCAVFCSIVGWYAKTQQKQVTENQIEIKRLREDYIKMSSKLWSEEKLEKTIESAVTKAFLYQENKQLKQALDDKRQK